jgi:hypothetical protein
MNIMFFILAVATMLQQTTEQNDLKPAYPWPELSMKCYPTTLMPGDSLYILLEAKNPYRQSIFIQGGLSFSYRDIQIHITDLEHRSISPLPEKLFNWSDSRVIIPVELKSGETREMALFMINIPHLKDFNHPLWLGRELPQEGRELLMNVFVALMVGTPNWKSPDISLRETGGTRAFGLRQGLLIKPRPDKEMEMLKHWYTDALASRMNFHWLEGFDSSNMRHSFYYPKLTKNIRIKGEWLSQWYFVSFPNCFPPESNAPETWQGWKELEESVTPSTMRDEIRKTRILIQYCDTQDPELLKELKEWFADMNEIQRAFLARTIRYRAEFDAMCDLYRAIHEYDIAAKSDSEMEWLKSLELLE